MYTKPLLTTVFVTLLLLAGTNNTYAQFINLNVSGLSPHIGQQFQARLIDKKTLKEADRTNIVTVSSAEFTMSLFGAPGASYFIDFYAGLNKNGAYDAPPDDHAWRVNFDDKAGDEVIDFEHNTNFTDIMIPSSVEEIEALKGLDVFPNPFSSSISVTLDLSTAENLTFNLYNSLGQMVRVLWNGRMPSGENTIVIRDLNDISSGVYFLEIRNEDGGVSHVTLMK